MKYLTFLFEVQSSIEEGQPRKESQKRRRGERKEKWTAQCPPYVIYPIVKDTNLSSDALGAQQGIFVCSSSLIWLIYSWDRNIVYPHTTLLNWPSFSPTQWDLGTHQEHQRAHPSICLSTCSQLPPSRISHHHANASLSTGTPGVVGALCLGGGGYQPGNLFVKLVSSRHGHCRQPGPCTEVQGPVSCCAFMQLGPFWHKCVLTTGAAPS